MGLAGFDRMSFMRLSDHESSARGQGKPPLYAAPLSMLASAVDRGRRMKSLLSFALVALASVAASGPALADIEIPPVTYPKLARQAPAAEGFVPAGWQLETKRTGDLNADGRPDLLLVIKQNDPRNVVRHDAMGRNPFDTNPRILAVAFARADGGYALAAENHTLIPRPEYPTMDDPLDPNGVQPGGIEVKNGALRVALGRFMSAGGWGMGRSTFTFRWQKGRFELIGFDSHETQRNTGEIVDVSINFSTGRVSVTKTNMETDAPGKPQWSRLPPGELMTLDEIENGLEFEPPQ
jgi:hypothetical protein